MEWNCVKSVNKRSEGDWSCIQPHWLYSNYHFSLLLYSNIFSVSFCKIKFHCVYNILLISNSLNCLSAWILCNLKITNICSTFSGKNSTTRSKPRELTRRNKWVLSTVLNMPHALRRERFLDYNITGGQQKSQHKRIHFEIQAFTIISTSCEEMNS